MLADQAARAEQRNPINRKQSLHFAKMLLAKLDGVDVPEGPARVSVTSVPPLENDHVPTSADPEPLEHCFSDLLNDD